MNRTIILHYHLFKNAGTSLDAILKDNFGDKWITKEFSTPPKQHPTEVANWIRENPEAIAFSSHTALGPLPKLPGVNVISVLFLRDPIDRIRSVYAFERIQTVETMGTRLAASKTFEGYVRARLEIEGDRQCRNFQTTRLARYVPGAEPEVVRAKSALQKFDLVGLVENFNDSMSRFANVLRPHFPDFSWKPVHRNISPPVTGMEIMPSFQAQIEAANADDVALLQEARLRFLSPSAAAKT